LILWIAVPSSSSLQIGSQRKRLFRDTETKMIAGVCSGLAQYFNVQIWIPRVLFLIPFFSFVFRWGHWGWWDFPHFLSFSFSPGSIVVYIILWLILPEAKTTADKLEMKGEKVDLNNIKTTIQGDLEGFKDRAEQFGSELKERAQSLGADISTAGKRFGAEASAVGKRTGGGIGHVIKVIVKIFVYFFIGCILLSIVGGLFAVGVVLTGLLPAYSYVLDSGYQEVLAWCSLIFFVWVPVIAIVTWIIRKLTGKKGNSGIIRLTFLSFWILGVICFVNLIISIGGEFRYRNYPTEQTVALSNPRVNKREIKAASFGKYYSQNWLRLEPFASFNDDTVYVRNVRLRITKSPTDSFSVVMVKMANGSSKAEAEQTVSRINYRIAQTDSVLLLGKGLPITREGKFRNQQVIVTVAVPVGKRIFINENVGRDENVRVSFGRDNDWNWENNFESPSYRWRQNVQYVMTDKGLERADKMREDESDNNNNSNETIEQFRKSKEQMEREKEQKLKELQEIDRELQRTDSTANDSTRYRYRSTPATPATPNRKTKTSDKTITTTNVAGISDMLMVRFAL
ncbi:MAG: PspC domain-containing protein, partial [Segetibacter sp.]